ncbi:polymer-forming cytoskeletal protein [Pseudomonas sp. ZM23]|uniref:Polymer-forming cytoskeletal protein n=1 Tax=Pseudomonas triclosanedens TaxID=2961893 RepID=A0ABY7A1F5_9PSED|nr:polymer-forming cytoskeletal protein [Pseudomonas triclosanedens]MCP8463784.1 polymer-forming cytoskeletal protein [Pseudomonas triclosanedens]MCP8468868.1 polymer-forming cytoskeletal protein [Pseudomonas triclosanedens]MCP8475590.1 polymer-forming cytoskeletal protein [Pseudomonas triclosanedens]WAI50692.1 polymer-forming cytoskeletal protein [Pseudomonas triclosanedens]
MFSNSKKKGPQVSVDKFSSLLSGNVSLVGDLQFQDGLKVLGTVKGNVSHKPGAASLLALSAEGRIEGNVSSYDALIDGTIIGDLYVEHLLELHSNARIVGNIRYRQLSMENGATVDGKLTCLNDTEDSKPLELPAPSRATAEVSEV